MMTTPPLQSSLQNQNGSLSLSSSLWYSQSHASLVPTKRVSVCYSYKGGVSVTCSISKIHNYGTVDYERRPTVKWNVLYKRISLMDNPEFGSASVLNQWENEGKTLTKWELCRVVKELRKYRKHDRALQIYDWINNRPERFRISASDAAIQLDLIARVHGVSSAEGFFLNLVNDLKDKRTYGALLNAYVHSRSREKAESLLDVMRSKRYLIHSLPFNLMMTLYMNLQEYDKVDMLVSEMKEKCIQLDIYTYNIWLSSCGSQGSIEKMEQVFEQMSKDPTIMPNWSTFSTMAAMYIKMELFDKAEECLKKVEGRILGRDRVPFHYLLSLYGSVGNKDEVYRVWNTYKSMFPSIPNLGYHAAISSLVRMDDIEGAGKLYEEWVSVRPSDDSRIGNLLICWYLKKGKFDKVLSFFEHMTKGGGCPNATTWELLSECHIAEKRVSDALSCLKKAFMTSGSKSWKPKPIKLLAFFKLCRDQDNMESAEVLIELLKKSGYDKDEAFASLIGEDELSNRMETVDRTDDIVDNENMDDDDSHVLFNQVESNF
ncbi:pentatricopeptide repeat-containing protein At1g02150-like [Cicer arietinum]|uniref:Pentatricopeptide repeat-containing protein At1g02150-like n=1 Tax=Cicer arietinum TaxID=3827 RepID=A0A1S2Z584_CICAR|nr:pentatricopeptide repeat-containing protein At1g02150-like [Cicer arietinum]